MTTPWHRRRPLLRAYLLATCAASVVFLARGIVQSTLFRHNATGWLAFARIAMGFPLYIAAVGVRLLGGHAGPASAPQIRRRVSPSTGTNDSPKRFSR